MLESLGGITAHPLLVHVPVVIVPLAAIGALLLVVRPRWLQAHGLVVTVLAGVGFLGSVLAASSGEDLEETRIEAGETISATLRDHAEMGDSVKLFAGLFFLLMLGWLLFSRWQARVGAEKATAVVRKPRLVGVVLASLVVLSGVVATVSVTLTGHSGAESVWDQDAP
ncbi:MAG: hypothetical protein Q7V88_09790 [Actinomycetota bacterium]|nr:hypothetical protein [Actinomycetota bacterium]